MKEFTSNLNIFTGLRKDSRHIINGDSLTVSKNLRPTEFGLKVVKALDNIEFDDAPSMLASGFPYPQIFKTSVGYYILAYSNRLFKFTALSDISDVNLTEISLVSYKNLKEYKAIPDTAPNNGVGWKFADLGGSWVLYNGSCSVFTYSTDKLSYDTADIARVNTDVSIRTGCGFNGRNIMAGFNGTNFWLPEYERFWETWIEDVGESPEINFSLADPPTDNFVHWTSIGGGDTFWLLYPEVYTSTGLIGKHVFNENQTPRSKEDPILFDYLKTNQWGFMPMPFKGMVRNVEKLGNAVVAYCDNGVALMPHVSEPVPTFGLQKLLDIGIMSGNALGVSDGNHIWIDTEGTLWSLGADYKLDRLGYKEYLKDLDNPIISYCSSEKEFIIDDGIKSYILSSGGLTESTYSKTSSITMISGYTIQSDPRSTYKNDALTNTILRSDNLDTTRIVDWNIEEISSGTAVIDSSDKAVTTISSDNALISGSNWIGISQSIKTFVGSSYGFVVSFALKSTAQIYKVRLVATSTDLSSGVITDTTFDIPASNIGIVKDISFTSTNNTIKVYLLFQSTSLGAEWNIYWTSSNLSTKLLSIGNVKEEAYITTDIMDFGHKGIKTIQWLEVGYGAVHASDKVYVKVHYRYNKIDAFSSTDYILVNDEGYAYVPAGGTEFKFEVFYDSNGYMTDTRYIDYVNVKYKATDKRFIRGIYGNQANAK